jgi:hypothetical protein
MFIREDLPTFDLPMNATSGSLWAGFCETIVLLPANLALEILVPGFICSEKVKFELQNWRKDSKKIRSMKKDGENISGRRRNVLSW